MRTFSYFHSIPRDLAKDRNIPGHFKINKEELIVGLSKKEETRKEHLEYSRMRNEELITTLSAKEQKAYMRMHVEHTVGRGFP